MMAMDCQRFDFRKAGYVDEPLLRQIRHWSNRATKIFGERWQDLAPTQVTTEAQSPATQSFATLLESLEPLSIGCTMQIDSLKLPTLITVSQVDLLTLAQEILCENKTEKPEARQLTTIEIELGQLVIEGLCAGIAEAWPQKETLSFSLSSIDPTPHRSRMFLSNEYMIVVNFAINALAGKCVIQWALPRTATSQALASFVESNPSRPAVDPREAVTNIPVELVVQLGQAQLSMNDLTQLDVGDIVILDQRIDEPIVALIDDAPFYKGWPGRAGADTVFKINRIIS